jgi:ABC-2 type transport system ATP-binding protein
VKFSAEVDKDKLAAIANLKEFDYPSAVLAVKREVSSVAAAELLKNFPIEDLNVEEPPIEDIIRELFTGEDVA